MGRRCKMTERGRDGNPRMFPEEQLSDPRSSLCSPGAPVAPTQPEPAPQTTERDPPHPRLSAPPLGPAPRPYRGLPLADRRVSRSPAPGGCAEGHTRPAPPALPPWPGRDPGRRLAAAAADRPTGGGSAPVRSARPAWRRGGAPRGRGSWSGLAPPPQVGRGRGSGAGRGPRAAGDALSFARGRRSPGLGVRGSRSEEWETWGAGRPVPGRRR